MREMKRFPVFRIGPLGCIVPYKGPLLCLDGTDLGDVVQVRRATELGHQHRK